MKKSAGILLYKWLNSEIYFFIAHPGGPFWKNKDARSWSIPKGEFSDEEEPIKAALREFKEETGIDLEGNFIELTPVFLKSGKKIFAWALEKDVDPDTIFSNEFELEWPPKSGKFISVAEIDKCGWFKKEEATQKLNVAQGAFLEELISKL